MGRINYKLFLSAGIVNLSAFACGNAYSWSSSVLVDLKSTDPTRNPLGRPSTSFEESWIASLISLGAVCGTFVSGFLAQKFGRKSTLLAFSAPMIISNLILAFASTAAEFYVARFMLGIGIGCVFTVVPMYIGEIAKTEIRGLLGCFMGLFVSLGLFFVYAIGPFCNLKQLSFILIVPIIAFVILFGLFIPESPYYYVSKGQYSAAESSLNKLRGGYTNEKELVIIKQIIEKSMTTSSSLGEIWKSKSFRNGITITTTIMVFQQCVGITVVLSYMENIFVASGSTFSSYTSTVAVSLMQVLVVLLTSYLADKSGRKFLLTVSSAGMTLPLIALGFYFYKKNSGDDVSQLWWLPVLSLVSYIITYNLAFSTLPWALAGELFSSETKSLASSITAFTCYMLAFLTTVIFPTLESLLGIHNIFWMFSLSSLLAFFYALRYIPETKGKTFQEIALILER